MRRKYHISGFIIALGAIGLLAQYFVLDGRLPRETTFELDLDVLRSIASAPVSDLPHTVEVEIVAKREVPGFVVQAGFDYKPVTLARAVFRLRSNWGDILIDVGMNDVIARKFSPDDIFYPDASQRVSSVLESARRIVVTHEHPDHIGLLGRYNNLSGISEALRLTPEQLAGIAKYTADLAVPAAVSELSTIPNNKPTRVAPGVAMLPAPGHTPGSVVFFVTLTNGTELLFVGDIVWNMSNIRNARGRSRLVQEILMHEPENRSLVYEQVATLVELSRSQKDLIILPSHDEDHINTLIGAGTLSVGFGE
jgi:glyoxylase-like metal-dependent hydrolase (beta-lactamase superfamily II)